MTANVQKTDMIPVQAQTVAAAADTMAKVDAAVIEKVYANPVLVEKAVQLGENGRLWVRKANGDFAPISANDALVRLAQNQPVEIVTVRSVEKVETRSSSSCYSNDFFFILFAGSFNNESSSRVGKGKCVTMTWAPPSQIVCLAQLTGVEGGKGIKGVATLPSDGRPVATYGFEYVKSSSRSNSSGFFTPLVQGERSGRASRERTVERGLDVVV